MSRWSYEHIILWRWKPATGLTFEKVERPLRQVSSQESSSENEGALGEGNRGPENGTDVAEDPTCTASSARELHIARSGSRGLVNLRLYHSVPSNGSQSLVHFDDC